MVGRAHHLVIPEHSPSVAGKKNLNPGLITSTLKPHYVDSWATLNVAQKKVFLIKDQMKIKDFTLEN